MQRFIDYFPPRKLGTFLHIIQSPADDVFIYFGKLLLQAIQITYVTGYFFPSQQFGRFQTVESRNQLMILVNGNGIQKR